MMVNLLHDELHKLCDTLINIKTVIEASDKHLHELYKKHIALVSNSEERVKSIQEAIDKMMDRITKDDNGAWPT